MFFRPTSRDVSAHCFPPVLFVLMFFPAHCSYVCLCTSTKFSPKIVKKKKERKRIKEKRGKRLDPTSKSNHSIIFLLNVVSRLTRSFLPGGKHAYTWKCCHFLRHPYKCLNIIVLSLCYLMPHIQCCSFRTHPVGEADVSPAQTSAPKTNDVARVWPKMFLNVIYCSIYLSIYLSQVIDLYFLGFWRHSSNFW